MSDFHLNAIVTTPSYPYLLQISIVGLQVWADHTDMREYIAVMDGSVWFQNQKVHRSLSIRRSASAFPWQLAGGSNGLFGYTAFPKCFQSRGTDKQRKARSKR